MPDDRPPPDRIVLIHGAWAGGWVWEALTPDLALRTGLPVAAPDLPGCGADPTPPGAVTPDACLARVAEAMGDARAAVLVGHSGGGMAVTLAAERLAPRVAAAAYVAGMLLPDGSSFDAIQQRIAGPGGAFGITPHIRVAPDGLSSTVPRDAAIAHFFHDCPPTAARMAAARLGPQPAATHRMTTRTGPAFAALPKLYVEAAEDRSVLPAAQRMMQAGVPNLTVRRIATGHTPHLSRPAALAAMLAEFVATLRAGGEGFRDVRAS